MSRHRTFPLRELTPEERQFLVCLRRSATAPASQVARAKALLAVADGDSYVAAAQAAGRRSGDAVAALVARFNQEGLAAVTPRHGRGRPLCYTAQEREHILAKVRQPPDRIQDGTAVWSISLLQKALRREGLPQISRSMIWSVLREAGLTWQRQRTWCDTGMSRRQRQQGGCKVAGHKSPELVCWLMAHGILPLYTPVGGSWLNMAESMQRILVRRALAGQQPETPAQIMTWLEAVAQGWNVAPTPFSWGGKRALRRQRQRERHHSLGGSGAIIRQPLTHPRPQSYGYKQSE
jgi:transposase